MCASPIPSPLMPARRKKFSIPRRYSLAATSRAQHPDSDNRPQLGHDYSKGYGHSVLLKLAADGQLANVEEQQHDWGYGDTFNPVT